MNHWLVKTEPETFSWDDMARAKVEPWTGVRSRQAAANLSKMACGDRVFFYHSNQGKEIVGIVEVVREAYPDPTAADGGWVAVDMRAGPPFPRPVTLAAMKADPALAEMPVVRLARLSVSPVAAAHWRYVCALGGIDPDHEAATLHPDREPAPPPRR